MFCVQCGTNLPDDSKFCRSCGHAFIDAKPVSTGPVAAPALAPAAAALQPAATQPKKQRTVGSWQFLLVIALIAGVVLWAVLISRGTGNAPSPLQHLAAQQYTQKMSQESLTVAALQATYTKFVVPQGSFNERFQGTFSATGGMGNDIEVYILSDDDFVNWQNRHPAKTFYNSGRVTQGTINVSLPAGGGTYYVVFNNRFSLLTGKDIEAHVTLTYSD